MTVDVLGPASALNSVTSRPAQAVTYGATRTWFKNCTSLTSADGTELTNDWLNNMLAQLRSAFDGAGIVEDNGDDMLLRAIQSLGIRYGSDIGSVNALAVTFSPPVTALATNLTLLVKVANTNTNAGLANVTINPNGLGAVNIVGDSGQPLLPGQLLVGQEALLQYNGTAFQLLTVAAPRWRKFFDVTVPAGGLANVDINPLPTWASEFRITVMVAGDPATQHNVWMRVTQDGTTFPATGYYADVVGGGSNANGAQAAMPISGTVDISAGTSGAVFGAVPNVSHFFPGSASARPNAQTDYWAINGGYGTRYFDYGKVWSEYTTIGKALGIRFLGGGYFATGPTGSNILAGTRIIVEGMI